MLMVPGSATVEVARLQAILAGVERAFVVAFATPSAWPETLRPSVQPAAAINIQLRGVNVAPSGDNRSLRLGQRYITIEGQTLVRAANFSILGEGRNQQAAWAIYACAIADTLNFPGIQTDDNDAANAYPDADGPMIRGPASLVNVGGEGKVDLAMLIPWSVRTVIETGQLLNDPSE